MAPSPRGERPVRIVAFEEHKLPGLNRESVGIQMKLVGLVVNLTINTVIFAKRLSRYFATKVNPFRFAVAVPSCHLSLLFLFWVDYPIRVRLHVSMV